MKKKLYLIVDYCATSLITHHWSYILSYEELLIKFKSNYEILLPVYAEKDVVKIFSRNPLKLLKNSEYGPTLKSNFCLYFFNKIIEKTIELMEKLKIPKSKVMIAKIVRFIYNIDVVNYIKKTSSGNDVVLIFPTCDRSAIDLIEYLIRKKIDVDRYCVRLIGAETRGMFALGNETSKLMKLSESCEKIKIGYEIFKNVDKYLAEGFNRKSLYWCPIPKIRADKYSNAALKKENEIKTVGFPGTAKQRKGFDHLPMIMRVINDFDKTIAFKLQEAEYFWPEYKNTIEQISKIDVRCEIYPSKISSEDYLKFIESCDFIILPYDIKSYKNAGSAILFQASDYNVPLIVKKGLDIEEEINKYDLGRSFSTIDEIPEILSSLILEENITYGFDKFTLQREELSKSFLNLEMKKE